MTTRCVPDWFRVAAWFAKQRALASMNHDDAVQLIRGRFDVSRATAYRWLAAWREVQSA